MKSYKELRIEKTKIRMTEPVRYVAISMILDGATKIAKKEQREIEEKDLIAAAKAQVSATEEAILKITEKGGDPGVRVQELAIYKTFLPQMKSEAETKEMLVKYFNLPEEERKPTNMGKVMAYIKAGLGDAAATYDMKIVSKLVKEYLA